MVHQSHNRVCIVPAMIFILILTAAISGASYGQTVRTNPNRDRSATKTAMARGSPPASSAWTQMFGESIPESENYVVIPYWIDANTIQMYLVDSTIPEPTEPSSVMDLLARWSIASGSWNGVGEFWDSIVSHDDGTFYQSIGWGYYQGAGPPKLLIGALASWGDSSDEHCRGFLDNFIPLQSEADIVDYQSTVFPVITDWTLDQVAHMLAEQIAGVEGMDEEEPDESGCVDAKPPNPNMYQAFVPDCTSPPIALRVHPCVAAFNGCAAASNLRRDAAYSTCDSLRAAADAALLLGCLPLIEFPPACLTCAVVGGGYIASAYKSCIQAATLTFRADMQACHNTYSACCQSDPTCPFR